MTRTLSPIDPDSSETSPPGSTEEGRRAPYEPSKSFSATASRYGLLQGVDGFAYRALRRLFRLRVGHVFCLDLAALSPSRNVSPDVEYHWLASNEVRVLAANPANDLDPILADRLDQGNTRCLAALRRKTLLSYCWFTFDAIEPEHSMGAGVTFPRDMAYLFKSFTLPDRRGLGLYATAIRHAAPMLLARGVSRLIAIVEHAETASMRCHHKLGFRQIGWFATGRRPIPWRRFPRGASRLGLHFGEQP